MLTNHLTDDELFTASFDKENLAILAQEHLSSCSQCQKTIADYQSINSLYKKQQSMTQPSLEFTNRLKVLARESIKKVAPNNAEASKWYQISWTSFWHHPALASAFVILIVAGLVFETRDVMHEHLSQPSPTAINTATERAAQKTEAPSVKPKPDQAPSEPGSSGGLPHPTIKPQRNFKMSDDEGTSIPPPDVAPLGIVSPGVAPKDKSAKQDSPAFEESKTAIAEPQSIEPQLKKAQSLQAQGRFKEALAVYDSLYAGLTNTSQGNHILFLSAQCYLGLHNNDGALQKLGELEQQAPQYPGLSQLKNKILKNK